MFTDQQQDALVALLITLGRLGLKGEGMSLLGPAGFQCHLCDLEGAVKSHFECG